MTMVTMTMTLLLLIMSAHSLMPCDVHTRESLRVFMPPKGGRCWS